MPPSFGRITGDINMSLYLPLVSTTLLQFLLFLYPAHCLLHCDLYLLGIAVFGIYIDVAGAGGLGLDLAL